MDGWPFLHEWCTGRPRRYGRARRACLDGRDEHPSTSAAGGNWNGGGNWHGRYQHGGYGPGIAAGVIAGAALGGAYAYGDTYYGDSYAYDPGYYGDTYAYDPGPTYDSGYVPYNNGYNAPANYYNNNPNGFVCQPGTVFKGEDGRPHLCQ